MMLLIYRCVFVSRWGRDR
uniref:Uncharacterized protein n=1 Tax=Anguilla anguilla TaxID=7936 RepID=A0A0E9UM50_ANGAN